MTPLGTYDSVLRDHNNLYILGSKPQDALTVNIPTQVKIAANAIGGNQTRFDFAFNGANGFDLTRQQRITRSMAYLPRYPTIR